MQDIKPKWSPAMTIVVGMAFAAFSVTMLMRDVVQQRHISQLSERTALLRKTVAEDHEWQVENSRRLLFVEQQIHTSVLRKEAMIRAMLKRGPDHWTDDDISRAIDAEIGNAKAAFSQSQLPEFRPPPEFKSIQDNR